MHVRTPNNEPDEPDDKMLLSDNDYCFEEDDDDVTSLDDKQRELTPANFFEITFGSGPLDFDSTQFVTDELTVDIVVRMVDLVQQNLQQGILRHLFPYLIDILSRTVSFGKLVDCIQTILANDPSSILSCLSEYSGRDFLIAFLRKIPRKAMPRMLSTLVSSNIPIPIYLSDNDASYMGGLEVLAGMRDLVSTKNYCFIMSFNLATTEVSPPFSKQLFPVLCHDREDTISLCHPGSIDISLHSASENHKRQPVAIAEVYNDDNHSKVLASVIQSLSQMACLMMIHISEEDFNGTQPKAEFQTLLHTISINHNIFKQRRIMVLFQENKQKKKQRDTNNTWNKRKRNVENLLNSVFNGPVARDEIIVKMIGASNVRKQLDEIKADIFKKILAVDQQYLCLPLAIDVYDATQIPIWPQRTTGEMFAYCMQEAGFVSGISEFGRRHIFQASYAEQQIENLKDKRHLTTEEDHGAILSEADICAQIDKFEKHKLEIANREPLSVLAFFAESVVSNDINKMRDFARDVDDFFKAHLRELSMLDHEAADDQAEQITRQRIKRQIEDHDISVHDFWREFVILARTNLGHDYSILKKLYGVSLETLERAYTTWVTEGEAMQMLDGLSLRPLDTTFLSQVLTSIMTDPSRQLLVISVIGLESSGKSTLLNYLFKCGFSTSAGRCTKGMYMTYRHSVFQGFPIDLLVLDSEGMGSTAQKYITRRSSFDKKITLLALMCSQIVIINTKGLTRDIANILEVSSFHLDALKESKSKPRLHFVLRDMMDTADAQKPAFNDIRASLEEMFREIPGCTQDLDDFMTVEQKDVHLLVNAFSSFNDDFRPRSENISVNENIHVPAETFPLKVSSLRQALLASAIESTYDQETKMFENVNGFIVQMKSTWAAIDARGSFLHFNDFKAIQKWNGMQAIVQNLQQKLAPFKEEVNNKILEYIDDLKADPTKWDDVQQKFFQALSTISAKHCDATLAEFDRQAGSQFDSAIKEEGKSLIRDMFSTEKLSLEAKYIEMERDYKETALLNNAEEVVGRAIQRYNSPQEAEELKRDKNKRDRLFNDAWADVEKSHDLFMKSIVDDDNQRYQVNHLFNRAITDGQSNTRSQDTSQSKFNRKFWFTCEKPSVITEEGIFLDHQNIHKLIEVKAMGIRDKTRRILRLDTREVEKAKDEATQAILEDVVKIISATCQEVRFHKSLRIEYGQTFSWLQRLCDTLFTAVTNLNKPHAAYHIQIEDCNIFEKYLRLEVFNTIRSNTKEWRRLQKEKLEQRKINLKKRLDALLVDNSLQNLSIEFAKDIDEVVKSHVASKESTVKYAVDEYLKTAWINRWGATHWAHERSFGKKDPNAVREYFADSERFMRKVFDEECKNGIERQVDTVISNMRNEIQDVKSKLTNEIENVWSRRAQSTLEQILEISKPKPVFEFVKRFSTVFGKHTIDDPKKLCEFLKKDLMQKFDDFEIQWRTSAYLQQIRGRLHRLANETITAKWDTLQGCTARCPACNSKCEGVKGNGHSHSTSTHVIAAFGGYKHVHTRQATLIICTEPTAEKYRWTNSKGEWVEIRQLMNEHQPPWIYASKTSNDTEIRNMRGVWWMLRDEWCKKFNMSDGTPQDWVQYSR